MTLGDISNKITFFSGADINAFSNANRLISINNWCDKIHTMILSSMDGWDFDDKNNTDFSILTADLVADQQDYSLPSTVLKIKRVNLLYETGGSWKKAEPIDVNEMSSGTDTTSVSDNFDKTKPFYDLHDNSIFFFPIPDKAVSGGFELYISRFLTAFTSGDLTTGTATPGFDRNFHEMVAIGSALDFAISKGKKNANQLATLLADWEKKLKSHYGDKNKDRNYQLKSSFVDYE